MSLSLRGFYLESSGWPPARATACRSHPWLPTNCAYCAWIAWAKENKS